MPPCPIHIGTFGKRIFLAQMPPARYKMAIGWCTMSKFARIPLFFLAVALLAAVSQAITIEVEVSWNSPLAPSQDSDTSNLQTGSIIQIIGWNSDSGAPSPQDAEYGGMIKYGKTANGDPILLPNTTPVGWAILATTSITKTGNDPAYCTVSIAVDVPEQYDKIFVRVFSLTEFPEGESALGYWGISEASNVSGTVGLGMTWFDNVAHTNVAYFEVIPEPSTLALLGCGITALALFPRRKHRKDKVSSSHRSHD